MEPSPAFPRLRYFGVHWGTPELDSAIEVPIPEGQACAGCQEPIEAHDDGYVLTGLLSVGAKPTDLPFHRGCHLRSFPLSCDPSSQAGRLDPSNSGYLRSWER